LPDRPVRILHAHSTFSLGGKEARAVRLMNAFGDAAEHVVLSATDQFGAREAIAAGVRVDFPKGAPSLQGKPGFGRYRSLARYMRSFDLVLTYNWGAMDVVGARRLFARSFGLPPLIHHEDGFNADEAAKQKPARLWFRRLMLPAARKLVVPSERLERIARQVWHQPSARIIRIPNGIAVDRYAKPPEASAIPGLAKREGQVVVGALAGLRGVKNLPRLVRAFASARRSAPSLADAMRLVIVGEGPERAAIEREMRICGVEDSLLPGFLSDPASYVGLFDIFALSSESEQFPISLVEAMAAGLPAVCTDVGDVPTMVADENQPFIVEPDDETGLAGALATLAADPLLRAAVGAANQAKARALYDERAMIARYAELYGEAIGRPDALEP
jgi:L-malate glycosyltransferase